MKNLKNWKMTVRQARKWGNLFAVCAIIAVLALQFFDSTAGLVICGAAAALLLTAALYVQLRFMRCPHCGQLLGRNYGEYCQFCGRALDEDASDEE